MDDAVLRELRAIGKFVMPRRAIQLFLEASGQHATAIQADVSEESGVVRLFEAADALGTRVGFVNNAGILEGQMRVETMDAGR